MAGESGAQSYGVVEGWEQLPDGLRAPRRRGRGRGRRGPGLPDLPRRSPDHPLRPEGQLPQLVGRGRVHLPHARHHDRPERHGLVHRRRQPHGPAVHARRQAADDPRHHEHAVRHGLRRQGLASTSRGRPGRSTGRPTSRSGRRATSTSPTATATAASTASRPAASSSSRGACPGTGPGQFHLPHGIAVAADGRVFVCDRENDRIQIFSPDGEYLSEWTDTQRPTHIVFDAQRARPRVRAVVAHGPDLAAPRAHHGAAPGPRERLRPGRQAPGPLGRAGRHRRRQLRGAARPRRGLPRRRLRERGHLDLRGEPRARPRGHATPSRSSRSRSSGRAGRAGRAHRRPARATISSIPPWKSNAMIASPTGRLRGTMPGCDASTSSEG